MKASVWLTLASKSLTEPTINVACWKDLCLLAPPKHNSIWNEEEEEEEGAYVGCWEIMFPPSYSYLLDAYQKPTGLSQ